jgi:tetratricopeptide (TPR) repeat protein
MTNTTDASERSKPGRLPDAQAELKKVRELVQHEDFTGAMRLCRRVHSSDPDNKDAWYLLAVSQRYLKQLEQALHSLQRLQQIDPEYGRAWQEIGHIHRLQDQSAQAIAAFARAVQYNPGLIASWRWLSTLQHQAGDDIAGRQSDQQYQRLAALPRELISVTSMLHEGKLYKAEKLCRHFLKQNPKHVEGMRLLARIGSKLHVYDDAEFLLESALVLQADFVQARYEYVEVLHKRQKFAQAHEQAAKLYASAPDNPAFITIYANQCVALGSHSQALELYAKALSLMPDNPGIHLLRGHALKTIGEQQAAIDAYRHAAHIRPELGDAWWSLANLKTYRFSDEELGTMREQLQRDDIGHADRYHLEFALGKALEDREDHENSFRHYQQGNRLKQQEVRYQADQIDAEFSRQKEFFSAERMQTMRAQKAGDPAPDPIFVVGLPRAGSTLIEQILASHPQIDGTLELPNILALVHRLNGRRHLHEEPRYPGVLADLDAEKLTGFGRQYLDDTRIHRQQAPLFIDKMPNNFRHLGLIHLILPNARIIDARRHPLDCCFSGYKQLFAEGQEFSYSLENIGRYYAGYVDLMAHWHKLLPDAILQVDYENVVDDLEGQVRRMLDFLQLPFDPACVEFHKTRRSVRTASSEQVRQPIQKQKVPQWQPYEAWLGPLKQALDEHMPSA